MPLLAESLMTTNASATTSWAGAELAMRGSLFLLTGSLCRQREQGKHTQVQQVGLEEEEEREAGSTGPLAARWGAQFWEGGMNLAETISGLLALLELSVCRLEEAAHCDRSYKDSGIRMYIKDVREDKLSQQNKGR